MGTTTSVEAEAAIRRRIRSGAIPPGSWLRESTLAADLGVSRTPVRDACNRLASEGWLRWVPNCGFRATELDPKELDAVYPVLVALEELAVRCIVEPLEELALTLRSLDLRAASSRRDVEEVFETDHRWHRRLIESARNPVLLETHDRMSGKLARYLHAYWRARTDHDRSANEHERVIEALLDGDRPLAAALLRSHRLKGLRRIRGLMEDGGGAASTAPRSSSRSRGS